MPSGMIFRKARRREERSGPTRAQPRAFRRAGCFPDQCMLNVPAGPRNPTLRYLSVLLATGNRQLFLRRDLPYGPATPITTAVG